MLSITRLLWVSGHINVSNPTLTPRSRFFHTLLLSLQVLQRATFRWQPSADDRSHPFTKMMHRGWAYFQARLAFTMAAFNVLVQWPGLLPTSSGFVPLSIAEFSL